MGVKYPTISQYRNMKWHDISISWLGYDMNPIAVVSLSASTWYMIPHDVNRRYGI